MTEVTEPDARALHRFEDLVERFEREVLAQEDVPAEHYDAEYFTDDWREGDNRYDVESRRRIEARNPQLIKEVFEPQRVLDMGCGPGFLMLFLHELGLDVTGIDFSPSSRELAPEPVRDRIIVGGTDERHVEERSFDLVICREVFEHLTVLQARRTVAQICAASSRFVYATTRYHPDPPDLLALTTQFEVDPTHITLMSKALLRTLFVLEGFRARPDLEQRMDWGGKGRVLVYERHATG
jgi:2-polyprenyl-3-methyl-5-hydroxy-6-metoxy-1,4-benzoquinol methylase